MLTRMIEVGGESGEMALIPESQDSRIAMGNGRMSVSQAYQLANYCNWVED